MDRKEFKDKTRVQFDEFLEVLEMMDFERRKEYVDNYFNYLFNVIYDQGAYEENRRSLKIMDEMKEGFLEKTKK